MTHNKIIPIILAAGKGTRMRSHTPKVFHPIAGLPMVAHVIQCAAGLDPEKIIIVLSPETTIVKDFIEARYPSTQVVWQSEQKGTGHAVLCAKEYLQDPQSVILVLFGDTPLIQSNTLQPLIDACNEGAAVTIMAFHDFTENRYGRVITNKKGQVDSIVEFKDLEEGQEKITLCNSGVMALRGDSALSLLERITDQNAAHEYYLTEVVQLARQDGHQVHVIAVDKMELMGVNSRAELAQAEKLFQKRLREQVMASGVTLIDPDTVYLQHDTVIGQDTIIYPHVIFGANVKIGQDVEVRSFCRIEGAEISDKAVIGPFAHIRTQSFVGAKAVVGNFAELKNASLGEGVKACHHSYLGDCEVGDMANIGAGTVTCNFDGFAKNFTKIGKGAFVGANTSLVAPLSVGSHSIIGAGSTITETVDSNAISVTRPPQQHLPEGAVKFRRKRMN